MKLNHLSFGYQIDHLTNQLTECVWTIFTNCLFRLRTHHRNLGTQFSADNKSHHSVWKNPWNESLSVRLFHIFYYVHAFVPTMKIRSNESHRSNKNEVNVSFGVNFVGKVSTALLRDVKNTFEFQTQFHTFDRSHNHIHDMCSKWKWQLRRCSIPSINRWNGKIYSFCWISNWNIDDDPFSKQHTV